MKKNKSKIQCILLAITLILTSLLPLSVTAQDPEYSRQSYESQHELNTFDNHDEYCNNTGYSVSDSFELDGIMYVFVEIDGISYLVEEEYYNSVGYENILQIFETSNNYSHEYPDLDFSIKIDETQQIEKAPSEEEPSEIENSSGNIWCESGACWYSIGCGWKYCNYGCGRSIWAACLPETIATTTYFAGHQTKCWERAILCSFCKGNVSSVTTGTHTYNINGICTGCGRNVCGSGHIWQAYESNGMEHFKRCQRFPDCIQTTSRGSHTAGTGWGRTTSQHWKLCSTCSFEVQNTRASHNWNSTNTACISCAQQR